MPAAADSIPTLRPIEQTWLADPPEFASRGDHRADGHCLWCGGSLGKVGMRWRRYDRVHAGPYGDGAFCSLRCGYAFGVEAAIQGMRFKQSTRKEQIG